MATEKLLQTRIQLKYDSYSEWIAHKNVVLKVGEIGICAIPSGSSAMNGDGARPQILFKVGDGTTTWENLPWASAKAADVYDWAKAASLPVTKIGTGNVVSSISWDETTKGIKFETIDVATAASFKEVSDNLSELTTKVNAMYTNTQIDGFVKEAKDAAAQVASDLADYEAANDARVAAVEKTLNGGEGVKSVLDLAKEYADGLDTEMDKRVDALEAIDHTLYAVKTEVANTYQTKSDAADYVTSNNERVTAVENAIKTINGTDGTDGILKQAQAYTDGKDSAMNTRVAVLEAIKHEEFAKSADVVSKSDFADFKTTNTEAIEDAEANAKAYADQVKAEILTGGAEGTLKDAYNTLLEIQTWIEGDGVNTTELTTAIATETKTRGEEISRVEGLIADEKARAEEIEEGLAANIAKFVSGDTTVKNAENATKATQDASGNVITATYETKTDAGNKLTEAKGYTDTEVGKAKTYASGLVADEKARAEEAEGALSDRLDAIEALSNDGVAKEAAKVSHSLAITLTDGTTVKSFDGSADVAIDLTSYATDGEVATAAAGALADAKTYADGLVADEEARAKEAEKDLSDRLDVVESDRINTITAGRGLKVVEGTNSAEIKFDTDVVFVFNCGSASLLTDNANDVE